MGIEKRSKGTMDAMLSPYFWTEEGMLTCEHSTENTNDTIWDRSTLYGMRCAFLMKEGEKRHLAGESALFVRVITEGMFGILPESLDSFSFIPQLPSKVEKLNLLSIHISGGMFSYLYKS